MLYKATPATIVSRWTTNIARMRRPYPRPDGSNRASSVLQR